jgi:hypothetical protein
MKDKKRYLKLLQYLIVVFGCLIIAGCGGGGGGGGDDDDSGDTQAPSVPSGLTATAASSSRINLAWSASTDDVAVTAYLIYRNNDFLKSVLSTSASDTGLTAETNYCYRVSAVDAANNESALSAQACATTSAAVLCGSLDVTDMQPEGDIEDLRPIISATVSSPCDDDIDIDSIEMSLDGNPVTPTVTGSGSEVIVTYRPATDLENLTTFTVEVSAEDVNGVSGETEWDFETGFFY